MGIIYGLCDPLTGELRYVGKSSRDDPRQRVSEHYYAALRRADTHVARWIRKVGRPTVVVLEQDPDDLDDAERWWIAKLSIFRLCNHTEGGDGGRGLSPSAERRAIVSAKLKGRPKSPETRARIAAAARRRSENPEYMERLRASLSARNRSDEQRAAVSAFHKGRKRSAQTRERIAAARRAQRSNQDTPAAPSLS